MLCLGNSTLTEVIILAEGSKWKTSYSATNIREAEQRLGIRIDELRATPIDTMLAKPNHRGAVVNKETVDAIVYDRITEYLVVEGFPTEANPDFGEANVSDLVLFTIIPVLRSVKKMRCDSIRLTREKVMTLVDNETGGMKEFVMVDRISTEESVGTLRPTCAEARKSRIAWLHRGSAKRSRIFHRLFHLPVSS